MKIRKAEEKDCPRLLELLQDIGKFHQQGRPDIFRAGAQKYSLTDLLEILKDSAKPIFVVVDETDLVQGYAMCQLKKQLDDPVFLRAKVLYLDDLEVSENLRGTGAGKALMAACKDFAQIAGCDRIELSVWEFPGSALEFYRKQGYSTQHRYMELKL